MELRDIEAFLSVVKHGGFRAAAEALFVSQPTLTRKIKSLEADLGVELLDRGPWGLRLNGHGQAFLRGSRRLMATLEEVRSSTIGAWDETIRLGAAASAAGGFLAGFLSRWIPDHPRSRIVMIEGGTVALKQRLADFECDVAILAAPIPDNFDHLPITRVRVEALLPGEHPLAQGTGPLQVNKLDGVGLLVTGRPLLATELTMAACRVAGVQPDVIYECTVEPTLAALAEAGLGVAIVGDKANLRGFRVARRDLHDVAGNVLEYELRVAWARNRPLSPIAAEFVETLSNSIQDLQMGSLTP